MASNLVFTAEKTEIGEQQSFSIRRSASDVGNIWDASLPWDSISDCIMTLTAGFATPAGQTYRGAIYQVRNIDGSHRPQSKLQWLDTDGQEYILSIFFDEIPYLVSALTELAEFEGIPLDLDATNLREITPSGPFDVQLSNALKDPDTLFRKRVIALAQQNSSDVTDETVSEWFEDLDSFTRQFLDSHYASDSSVASLTDRVDSSETSIEDLESLVQSGRLTDIALKSLFVVHRLKTGGVYPPPLPDSVNVFFGDTDPGLLGTNGYWANPYLTTLSAVVAAVIDTGSDLRKALQADSVYVPVSELWPEDSTNSPALVIGSSPNQRVGRQLSQGFVSRLFGGVKIPNTWTSFRIRPHWQHSITSPTAGKVGWAATVTRTPHNAGASAGSFYVDNASRDVVVSTASPVVTPPAGGIYSFMVARNANNNPNDTFNYPVQLLGVEFSKES